MSSSIPPLLAGTEGRGREGGGEVGCFLGTCVLCEHDPSGPIASREELKEKCVLQSYNVDVHMYLYDIDEHELQYMYMYTYVFTANTYMYMQMYSLSYTADKQGSLSMANGSNRMWLQ